MTVFCCSSTLPHRGHVIAGSAVRCEGTDRQDADDLIRAVCGIPADAPPGIVSAVELSGAGPPSVSEARPWLRYAADWLFPPYYRPDPAVPPRRKDPQGVAVTFSDADVDLVARAAFTWKWGPPDGWSSTWTDEAESHRDMAREVLEALDAAGRLLPEGAETRTEWGVKITWDDGHAEIFPCADRAEAADRYDTHVEMRRRGQWAVIPTLMQRDAMTYETPWRSASGDSP